MRLFLIRHAETVDNVAGLLAGSRDASLTAHGVLQAQRLAEHLASRLDAIGPVHRVFSSPMQRTSRTAQAVVDALGPMTDQQRAVLSWTSLEVIKVDELREKHMGALEGTKWGVKTCSNKKASAGGALTEDMETREQMSARAESFIDGHLVPALESCFVSVRSGQSNYGDTPRGSVLLVSHGIFLNVLLRSLLERFAPIELQRLTKSDAPQPKSLVSFSNTGFVEIVVSSLPDAQSALAGDVALRLQVVAVNSIDHLQGLRKTRGGIGSAAFDSKQRTMDSFFGPAAKKPRKE